MSVDYYVAVHAADWPTPAALNRCMTELHYPVRISGLASTEMDQPLATMPFTLGLVVTFESDRVELEASVTKLGPGSPYAFGLRMGMPAQDSTLPDGTKLSTRKITGPGDFVPADLNVDLRRIGVPSPNYKDGDYVITLSFRSSVPEYRAGAFLMAGLIKCANGLGFEFQQGLFGTTHFADALAQEAGDPKAWK
jgi:hypothetical protein